MKNIYYIHDNGGRPFMIKIKENLVDVYVDRFDANYDKSDYCFFKQFNANKIFIGKSPYDTIRLFGGKYDKTFHGNTILLKLDNNEYIFIGQEIFSFKSFFDIKKYVSPIGNSDVPYPYAIDNMENYYLLIENVVVKNVPKNCDPYHHYYHINLITPATGYVNPIKPIIQNFDGIQSFGINGETYMLRYTPDSTTEYERLVKEFGKDIYVIKTDGKKYSLTKNDYIQLMIDYENYEKRIISSLLQKNIIHERLW